MRPDSLKYQETIAKEFEAVKDRVRYLIGSAHWGKKGAIKKLF